jgi:hypothetical protein
MATSSPSKRKPTTRKTQPATRNASSRKAKRVAEVSATYASAPSIEAAPPTRNVPDSLTRRYKTLTREEKWEWHKAVAHLEPEEPRFHGVIYIDELEVWRGQDIEVKYRELRVLHPNKRIVLGWIDTAPIVVYL